MKSNKLITNLQDVLNKYKDNPLKYFLPLSTALIDVVTSNEIGLYQYKDEFLKCLENFENDPLLHIKDLAITICKKLNIKIEYQETISPIVQKIIDRLKAN